ncbi:hypothetical protein GCM10027020_20340 [Nocardioides salsibiostraticola]
MAAPAFARGGGGVSFEQLVGALQLTALLTGSATPLMGDTFALDSVTFQATTADVDDLMLTGTGRHSQQMTAWVGIRHNPTIAGGDSDFVTLLMSFLRTFFTERDSLERGAAVLTLVVGGSHTGATELAALTDIARDAVSDTNFATLVSGRNHHLRRRLTYLQDAITKAIAGDNSGTLTTQQAGADGTPKRDELTWRFLRSLRSVRVDVEEDVARDRTSAINTLAVLTDSNNAAAATVWAELVTIAVRDNPTGTTMDARSVRDRLITPIGPSPRHGPLMRTLAVLEDSLRARIRSTITGPSDLGTTGPTVLRLERADELAHLVEAVQNAPGSHVLVTGSADLGKSALAVAAADQMRTARTHVIAMHLGDVTTLGTAADPFEGRLGDVLADTAPNTVRNRLLFIDGVESDPAGDRIALLVAAAHHAGFRCVVVARDDVADDVSDRLSGATPIGAGSVDVIRHLVRPLSDTEVAEVVDAFPMLATFGSRPRASDLLSRVGLVAAIVRSGARSPAPGDPETPATELEIFSRYWERVVMVRRGDASAAGRADAAVEAARRRHRPDLARSAVDGRAMDSLRSDGVLAPVSAFSAADSFATDLDLDFATVRLLLLEGLHFLVGAVQPRSALRAARLAAQARLADQGYASLPGIRYELERIAATHGQRWVELAEEVLLGHPESPRLLEEAWRTFETDLAGLKRLMTTARRLHYPNGYAHSTRHTSSRPNPHTEALRPLVDLLTRHEADLATFGSDARRSYDDLVLAYLRGLAAHQWPTADTDTVAHIAIRYARRPHAAAPPAESVVLLHHVDPTWASGHLRRRVVDYPDSVVDAIESPYAVAELARTDTVLLGELATTYYLDTSDTSHSLDDGIREHSFSLNHIAVGAHQGPFQALLRQDPPIGQALVRAVIDRAATIRQRGMFGHNSMFSTPAQIKTSQPVVLDVPGLEGRRLVGDSQSWHWNRGTGVGARPAISAAMAYERWQNLRVLNGEDVAEVVGEILSAATTLTEAGIAHALLLRHRPSTERILAEWFRERLVSELEIGRVQNEYRVTTTPDDTPWSRLAPNEVAMQLAGSALFREDTELLAALPAVADALVASQTDDTGTVRAEVLLTASYLRPATYRRVEKDGLIGFVPDVPDDVVAALNPGNEDLARVSASLRLISDYSPVDITPHLWRGLLNEPDAVRDDGPAAKMMRDSPAEFADRFTQDLATAKSLAEDPITPELSIYGPGPSCAVAAFVLTIAHDLLVTPDDRAWALQHLLDHALDHSPFEHHSTKDQRAPSRAAARSLPGMLSRVDIKGPQRAQAINALAALAQHTAIEVRHTLASALRAGWSTACPDPSEPCHHEVGLDLVNALLLDIRRRDDPGYHDDHDYDTEHDGDENAGDDEIDHCTDDDGEALDPADLHLQVLTVAAAAAIDATTTSGCSRVNPDEIAQLARGLVHLVCDVTATGARDSDGFRLMAEAALEADRARTAAGLTAVMVASVASQFLFALALDWWRTSLFQVVEDAPHLAGLLADAWVPIARDALAVLQRRERSDDDSYRAQIAALLPPNNLNGRIDYRLDGLMTEWVEMAQDNDLAFETYASWAVATNAPAAEILDIMDGLFTAGAPGPRRIHRAHELFSHVLSQDLTTADETRTYKRVDQFVAAGHDDLRDLYPE